MIVINSNMLTNEPQRLNLVTSSRDYLTTVDYPLRPTVFRTWVKPLKPKSRWNCCYFPQSFPVYRMHRMISVVLCLLVMVLITVIAFVLVQVVPPQQMDANRSADNIENGIGSEEQQRKRESGLGLGRNARKLEDHPEYKRSIEETGNEEEDEEDYPDDEDEDDDLILTGQDDEDDGEDEYNPVFDMKYFDFSRKGNEHSEDIKRDNSYIHDKDQVNLLSSFRTPNIRHKWLNLPQIKLVNDFKMEIIENGIVFTPKVESLLPEPELSDAKIGQIQHQLRSSEVIGLQEPTWERCGRPKNQWLALSTGESACARYRYPDDYLLVGEVLSFYLSRLLSVGHVPPVVLSQPTGANWHKVKQEMQRAGWGEAPVVVLTPWFKGLVRDHMPSLLLETVMKNATLSILAEDRDAVKEDSDKRGDIDTKNKPDIKYIRGNQVLARDLKEHKEPPRRENTKELAGSVNRYGTRSSPVPVVAPVVAPPASKMLKKSLKLGIRKLRGLRKLQHVKDSVPSQKADISKPATSSSVKLKDMSERDLTQLLQWSDLLVFDYLTGHYDRVAYMQDAAEKEGQIQILSKKVHNLVRSEDTDALWLLDNESGLMDAYTLLYGTSDPVQSNRFRDFHRQMLESICLFRRSTMEAVLGLHMHPEPHVYLVDFAKQYEPLFHLLPDPLHNAFFVKYFPQRVQEVHDWIQKCIDRVQGHSTTR